MKTTSARKVSYIPWGFLVILLTCLPSTLAAGSSRKRENRFPSVDERVQLYMSNWYVPPCPDYEQGFIQYSYETPKKKDDWPQVKVYGYEGHPLVNGTQVLQLQSKVTPDMIFFMDPDVIQNCAIRDFDETTAKGHQLKLSKRIEFRSNMRMYCSDVQQSFWTAWNHIHWEQKPQESMKSTDPTLHTPALLQFGDNKDSHVYGAVMVPLIKKFRSSYTHHRYLDRITTNKTCYSSPRDILPTVHHTDRFQPIVWKLATHRHYEKLYQVYQKDTAWIQKKDMGIFRGQLTGSRDGFDKKLTDEENCKRLKRCRLVYNHANSTLVDAQLTSTRNRLPDVLNGVPLLSKKIDLSDIMEYKGIIMIEGNDVASGLKWALLSQSVVLMPPPKHTSWAMEEKLEPWVHYIPLDDFATDVEEKMQWVIDNDEEAQRIAERGTLWMEDLVFHPDAAEDDRLIEEDMVRRYLAHFKRKETSLTRSAVPTTGIRSKHSSTQIKRLFKGNPARYRVAKREGLIPEPKPLAPPKYPAIFEPTVLPNGWSAPPGPEVEVPTYPFQVSRTENKPNEAVGFLPVYSEFRYVWRHSCLKNMLLLALVLVPSFFISYPMIIIIMNHNSKDGAKVTTRIKRVSGDKDSFLSELRSVLQIPEPHNPNDDSIRIRTGGVVEVKGNRVREVKRWLAGLGF
eukprot:Nitzschia sp. Nitz4//scaffold9_size221794//45918//48437//NITZ4_001328-RA/size221794-processed-gene-0.7-mRNA-1//1//CDS//3329560947//9299//frame0